ncbi:conserved hypothetical protein [Theileria orientalis strain Shintoku]|uniref:RAP domain-containing protein n=1 Tax=Theileria orientalis strain Shintoku TaxID=869250 RepID=J4C2K7_THEOR|nr:conserved hypothetical protein [Theileria orientalis strain Shintoku]PVC52343.1 hypothetical protein MACL_00000823 [Theileria orientalis]BAM38861.1 conserved hypothetical protein [Theileria orientalis strain Shintoku]|eukprot:XP_009689162.1 conserved hypothetical protein [Theileria orientalis strain Shintoku]
MMYSNEFICFKNHFYSCVCKYIPINRNLSRLSTHINTIANKYRFYSTYYNKINEDASKLSVDSDSYHIINVLKEFTNSGYNSTVLTKVVSKSDIDGIDGMDIYKYLVFLQVCNKLKIKDLDLVSPISVNLSSIYSKLVTEPSENDFVDLKSTTLGMVLRVYIPYLALCRIYNELKLLYDPLFLLISNRFSKELEKFDWEELSLLLRTYSYQRYNEAEIVKRIHDHIKNKSLDNLDVSSSVSMYSSLAYLEYLSPIVKRKLESVFMEFGDELYILKESVNLESVLDVAYANLLMDAPSINDMEIVLSCLHRIANNYKSGDLSINFLRKFTVVVSYMKCLHRGMYNKLDDVTKREIMEILIKYNEHKRFESTIFVEKVSEHLKRMRIGCDVNTYKNGVALDIVEKDQNLVWMCNSYHRFYATTFNMTANSKLVTKLIRAFGYKVAVINYYQWGRMKCKRTRFAFLRMARYYALKDKREYDPKYSGWSLPYIWWNYTARDRLHISHYDHFNP